MASKKPEWLTPVEAGEFIQKRREELSLTQDQMIEQTGIKNVTYLSSLENGRHHIGRSEYFAAVAQVLKLSPEEMLMLKPNLIQTRTDAPHPLSAAANGYRVPKPEPRPIPDALLEAAQQFGGDPKYAGLREYRWQRWMEQVPHRERPSTPLGWLDFYMSVKDKVDPQEPEE